jgi:predicted Zn-dependent peptidase
VTSHGLFGSNQNQQSELVAQSIYEVGGSLNVSWSPDYTLIECLTTRQQFENALYALCQAVKLADFEPDTVKAARRAAAEDAAREGSSPFRVAYATVRALMYHESPYRSPFGGKPESVARMDRDKISKYYAERFTPANTVISIAGNVSADRAEHAARNYLVDYDRQSPKVRYVRPIEWPSESGRRTVKMATSTAFILAGFPAPGLADADYPALSVLTALVGGGKSSRLFRRLRESAGIGYVVGAQTPGLARENQLLAFVEYDPTHGSIPPEQVEAKLVEVVRSVLTDPPPSAEVERAKRYAAGSQALMHQRTRDRAFYPGWYELCGPGFDLDADFGKRVGEVTPADIQRLAKKCLAVCCTATVLPDK